MAENVISITAKTIQRVCGVNLMLSKIQEGSVGIEIGCHVGDTSVLFAARNPSSLMLVDPYVNQTKGDTWTGPDTPLEDVEQRMDIMLHRMSNTECNWMHFRTTSCDFFSKFDGEIDWCYVDGNHNYEFAFNDVRNSWDRLKSGGLIFVDDCHDGMWGKIVTTAVYDALVGEDYIIEHKDSDPMIVRKK